MGVVGVGKTSSATFVRRACLRLALKLRRMVEKNLARGRTIEGVTHGVARSWEINFCSIFRFMQSPCWIGFFSEKKIGVLNKIYCTIQFYPQTPKSPKNQKGKKKAPKRPQNDANTIPKSYPDPPKMVGTHPKMTDLTHFGPISAILTRLWLKKAQNGENG